MTTLTVTARGQVTFRKDVLQHLGIKPGEKIELDLLPDGRGILKAARQTGTVASFVGILAGRTDPEIEREGDEIRIRPAYRSPVYWPSSPGSLRTSWPKAVATRNKRKETPCNKGSCATLQHPVHSNLVPLAIYAPLIRFPGVCAT